jgi:hypothetical protein
MYAQQLHQIHILEQRILQVEPRIEARMKTYLEAKLKEFAITPALSPAELEKEVSTQLDAKLNAQLDAKLNAQLDAKLNAQLDAKLNAQLDAKLNAYLAANLAKHIESYINASAAVPAPEPAILPPVNDPESVLFAQFDDPGNISSVESDDIIIEEKKKTRGVRGARGPRTRNSVSR